MLNGNFTLSSTLDLFNNLSSVCFELELRLLEFDKSFINTINIPMIVYPPNCFPKIQLLTGLLVLSTRNQVQLRNNPQPSLSITCLYRTIFVNAALVNA